MARIGTFTLMLAGTLLALSSRVEAQTCTLGPFTSAVSLGTIDSAIDRASDGDVVCLRRGNTWSQTGGSAFTLSTGHPNASRVTICSSDNLACTDSTASGANAKIIMTDSGGGPNAFKFSASADGYTIKNLDFTGVNACDGLGDYRDAGDGDGAYDYMPLGLRDITFEGGVYDGFPKFAYMGMTDQGTEPNNIKFGTCANPMELKNCGMPSEPRWTWYGMCDNCSMSVYIHDYGPTESTGGQGHILDLIAADEIYTGTSDNITVECNHWVFGDGHSGGGEMLRMSNGSNAIIRDNTFRIEPDSKGYGISGIGFSPHGGANHQLNSHWDGAEIYRNVFDLGPTNAIRTATGSDIKIHSNIFDWHVKIPGYPSIPGAAIQVQEPSVDNPNKPDNLWIYNNTFYSPLGGVNLWTSQGFVEYCNGPGCGTGHQLYNNIFMSDQNQSDGNVVIVEPTCSQFGTNGVNIKNNFVYTPNDSTPSLPNCSASLPDTANNGFCSNAGCTSSGTWNTAPGFVDAANADFSLTSTSSPAYGMGAFGVGSAFPPAPTPSPSPTPTPTPEPTPAPAPEEPKPPAAPILLP